MSTRSPAAVCSLAFGLLLTAAPAGVSAADLTAADCAADRQAYLAQAESNREKRVAELTAALEATANSEMQGRLAAEREQAWTLEEQRRGEAYQIYRECMTYVRGSQADGG